ncbi:MAG: chorismate-binding protein, partial [Muribaculaceae bacterium]|nr:chorismate-binding protein [Muribaculaceae bacterium]
ERKRNPVNSSTSKLQGPSPSNYSVNRFKYRLPDSSKVISGGSQRVVRGFAKGFVIAPFANPKDGLMTIPFDICNPDSKFEPESSDIPPTTPREDYEEEIRQIIRSLDDKRGKTVAARIIKVSVHTDLDTTFDSLCASYPQAFVFMFSTPMTGTWIGASPELLIRKEGEFISTMALAGTRLSSEQDEPWDEKNREEQAMVTEFITNCLMRHCGTVTIGKTFTKKAGPIEHICTPISAYMPPSGLDDQYEESYNNRLRQLLTELSPTPAVCGSDRTLSIDLIRKCESFPREMYGGFCGPNDIDGISAFYVNLRSAKVSPDAVALYVGGGITPLSIPESEWQETDFKSKTILSKLKTSEE